ncbi:hypothetical protein AOG1_12830 [Geobacter sp. AOG1]|nr:hypothetical protein AOG1_12830 [Geobacter sp. AOG1]
MAYFKCDTCNQIYEDYYPPDDTCIKCKRGIIKIVAEYMQFHSKCG